MSEAGFQLQTAKGARLHVHRWLPPATPRAVLLIVHGMAEHGARYARLARALTGQDWAVYAPDLPGHGLSADDSPRGHFADREGWTYALQAIHALRQHLAAPHPRTPLFVLGHSMGSFLVQDYLVEHGAGLGGAVLSATNDDLGALRPVAYLLMRLQCAFYGPRHPSALAEALSFKVFNRPFEPARTAFDWLSRDPVEVDRYIADPLCGFRCSAALWAELLRTGRRLRQPQRLARIPRQLPILLIAGTADPVARFGKGPQGLARAYRAAGLRDVEVKLYQDGRHELLNDRCRDQVTADLLSWLTARLVPAGRA